MHGRMRVKAVAVSTGRRSWLWPCRLPQVHVSIVVTDVKDFTALTRRNPEAMSKAMGVHNNILRKACHAHAGYVLDQVCVLHSLCTLCLLYSMCMLCAVDLVTLPLPPPPPL